MVVLETLIESFCQVRGGRVVDCEDTAIWNVRVECVRKAIYIGLEVSLQLAPLQYVCLIRHTFLMHLSGCQPITAGGMAARNGLVV